MLNWEGTQAAAPPQVPHLGVGRGSPGTPAQCLLSPVLPWSCQQEQVRAWCDPGILLGEALQPPGLTQEWGTGASKRGIAPEAQRYGKAAFLLF